MTIKKLISWTGGLVLGVWLILGDMVMAAEKLVTFGGKGLKVDSSTQLKDISTITNIADLAALLVNFALSFVGLFAVAVLIYGGFMYITSGIDESKATIGIKTIKGAVIGILMIIASWTIVNTIIELAPSAGPFIEITLITEMDGDVQYTTVKVYEDEEIEVFLSNSDLDIKDFINLGGFERGKYCLKNKVGLSIVVSAGSCGGAQKAVGEIIGARGLNVNFPLSRDIIEGAGIKRIEAYIN